MQDDNLFGNPLNFRKDMAGYENGFPHCTKFSNDIHNRRTSQGVTALERFVEDDQIRVVHQCMSDFDSLPHAFAVLSNLLVTNI